MPNRSPSYGVQLPRVNSADSTKGVAIATPTRRKPLSWVVLQSLCTSRPILLGPLHIRSNCPAPEIETREAIGRRPVQLHEAAEETMKEGKNRRVEHGHLRENPESLLEPSC